MADRFRGWRGKAAIGAFILASVATGAWIKTESEAVVQPWTFGGQTRSQSLAGKICVSYTRNAVEYPGFLPETQWNISGLYSDAMVVFCPLQVVATPSEVNSINQTLDHASNGTIQEWLGFCLASENGPYGDRCAVVLIPHWSVVIPLLLIAAGLLAWPRQRRTQLVASSDALDRRESTRATPLTRRLRSRRPKLALAAACAAGVLVCGWIRSGTTADRLRFVFGPSQIVDFVSAKEGLVFRQAHTDVDEGFQANYRALSGKDHESLTFCNLRMTPPEGDLEFHAFEAVDFAVSDEGFEPIQAAEAIMVEGDLPPSNAVQQTGFWPTIGGGSAVNKAWEGVVIDWFGTYLSLGRNPVGITIAVPYWIPIIALALIAMLARRRPARATA